MGERMKDLVLINIVSKSTVQQFINQYFQQFINQYFQQANNK